MVQKKVGIFSFMKALFWLSCGGNVLLGGLIYAKNRHLAAFFWCIYSFRVGKEVRLILLFLLCDASLAYCSR